ncbi:hypothetical protein Pan216_00500 [Planctomycetes bacterium Pan216]|uniref:Glycosyltransferase 2-like domain-containing protein n=1 Tax=Kolteria novifilia TaxID=2527975 RepID=A0A518AWX5_9BACT|nr:hypothetical protein Pan216_00500 [Planctomycetes bacterium Pan216]
MSDEQLVVVVPVYHNAATLHELHARLDRMATQSDVRLRYLFVDDGSQDDSRAVLEELAAQDERVSVLPLVRNVGSFQAIRAGLDHAGDADIVAFLSADLQDPPQHLSAMIADWRRGSPVVLATRESRSDAWSVTATSSLFHRLFRTLALPRLPQGGYDFALLDRRVVDDLQRCPELHTSLTALIVWLGYPRTERPYVREARQEGRSMWTWAKRWNLAGDSFVAFSALPLRLASLAGGCCLLASLGTAVSLPFGSETTLRLVLASIFGVGGVQLLCVGVLGEYLWRALGELRQRPRYLVDEKEVLRLNGVASINEDNRRLENPSGVWTTGCHPNPGCAKRDPGLR